MLRKVCKVLGSPSFRTCLKEDCYVRSSGLCGELPGLPRWVVSYVGGNVDGTTSREKVVLVCEALAILWGESDSGEPTRCVVRDFAECAVRDFAEEIVRDHLPPEFFSCLFRDTLDAVPSLPAGLQNVLVSRALAVAAETNQLDNDTMRALQLALLKEHESHRRQCRELSSQLEQAKRTEKHLDDMLHDHRDRDKENKATIRSLRSRISELEEARRRPRCKAPDCERDHTVHYCKECNTTDSDHRSSKCPHGLIVYHQTSKESAQSSEKNGIDISKCRANGYAGQGFYAAKSVEDTDRKACAGTGWIVELSVRMGRIMELKGADHQWTGEKVRAAGYDSVIITGTNGMEFVIYDPKRATVLKRYPRHPQN
mmetsp:Transcript_12158/g.35189  ORF Transcript_12158/g.35189 Transcript_12158/m.35189 type:complete len:370 (+) Transcript_12158:1204-2313(+)